MEIALSIQRWQLELVDDPTKFKQFLGEILKLYSDLSSIVVEYLLPFTVNNWLPSMVKIQIQVLLDSLRDSAINSDVDKLHSFSVDRQPGQLGSPVYFIRHDIDDHFAPRKNENSWEILTKVISPVATLAPAAVKSHNHYIVWLGYVVDPPLNPCKHDIMHFTSLALAYDYLSNRSQTLFQSLQSQIAQIFLNKQHLMRAVKANPSMFRM